MRWGSIVSGPKAAPKEIDWNHLFDAYAFWKDNAPTEAPEFFNAFFKKLAGSNELQEALESGMSAQEWVKSYQGELDMYEKKTEQYSFYPIVIEYWDKIPCEK